MKSQPLRSSNLVVEEHVDDWVNDGAELGQDGGHHANHGSHQPQPAKGGHQRHDAIGHPAQHVAGHHGQHHQQDVLLSALSHQLIDSAHLKTQRDSYMTVLSDKAFFFFLNFQLMFHINPQTPSWNP